MNDKAKPFTPDSASQFMTYSEREALKIFAGRCASKGDMDSMEKTITMITHWMHQGITIPFSEYAGQWVNAQSERTDGNASTVAMLEQWSCAGRTLIGKGKSEYYPNGTPGGLSLAWNDETLPDLIHQQLNRLKAEHPYFGCNGMRSARGREMEHDFTQLFDNAGFNQEVKSCLLWLADFRLIYPDARTNNFSKKARSSYWLKYAVEAHNQKNYPPHERPHYITNVSFIVAMSVAGFQVKQDGDKPNAIFNIDDKALYQRGMSSAPA